MESTLKISEIEHLPPGDLRPYSANARTHSQEQVDQICASIKEFGFTNPVLISDDGEITAGHGRVLAALRLGLTEVPCLRLTGLTEEQRRAYVIADNKLALNAGWDDDLLRLELGELRDLGFNLDLVGFDRAELDALFLGDDGMEEEGRTEDDAVPPVAEWHVSKPGDVWVCGDHRVMCGDSTIQSDVDKLMAGELADMCWTDPPYNVNYKGTAGKIQNDNMAADAFLQFLREAFATTYSVLNSGASIYVAHADREGLAFRSTFSEAGFKLSGCIIWVKPSLVLGRSDYQWRHEPILYGWKPGAGHTWFGGRKQTTVIDAEDMPFVVTTEGDLLIDTGGGHIHVSGTDMQVEELKSSVLFHEKPARNAEHPTMKPVGIILEHLKNSSRRGDLIYDPFGGSGSTLIAAQKIGRRARLVEMDPKFADVIVRRWQDFTGKKAVLEENGKRFDVLLAARKSEK